MLQLKVEQFRAPFFKMDFHSFKEINSTNGDFEKCWRSIIGRNCQSRIYNLPLLQVIGGHS